MAVFPTANIFERRHSQLYKELEAINFEAIIQKDSKLDKGKDDFKLTRKHVLEKKQKVWISEITTSAKNANVGGHNFLFQKAMRTMLIIGQFLGLNPVTGILERDASQISFNFWSWKCFYSYIVCSIQITSCVLCVYKMCTGVTSMRLLIPIYIYLVTVISIFIFLRIAKTWSDLMREIKASKLDEYVDTTVTTKCSVAAVLLLVLSILDYLFGQAVEIVRMVDCFPRELYNKSIYRVYLEQTIPWIFEIGIPANVPVGIIVQVFDLLTIINLYYLDIFIICISLYIVSILNRINKKIYEAYDKLHSQSYWRLLREDYTRATRLVCLFDDVISSVIFIAFTNNLFFICFQLFNALQQGVTKKQEESLEQCPNYPSGPLKGYEHTTYFIYSLVFVIARFLTVSLIASRIHSATHEPALALYEIPTDFYNSEIQRFIEQINSDNIALSGLQFFYITKRLILTVASTIVTYELVLLQTEL